MALLSARHGGLLLAVEAAIRNAIATIGQRGLDCYLEKGYPTYVAPRCAEDAEVKGIFFKMAHEVGADVGVRQMRALLGIQKPFGGLEQIRRPTAIIGGREDRRPTPGAHVTLTREIPEAELVIVDGAAHFTPLEQPSVVTKALRDWMRF